MLEGKITYAFIGSYGCTPYRGCVSAFLIILWVSYNMNPENSNKPPYNDIDINPAPKAVVGGRNADPK